MTDADPNLAREQRKSSALQQLLGYRLVEWEADRAVIAYDVAADHLNRTNRLHGGIIATLCDTAAGYAGVWCDAPGETRSTVTLSLTVNFLASVSGGRVFAEARRRPKNLLRRRRGARRKRAPDRDRDRHLPLCLGDAGPRRIEPAAIARSQSRRGTPYEGYGTLPYARLLRSLMEPFRSGSVHKRIAPPGVLPG